MTSKLSQLNSIHDDYDLMLIQSENLIGYNIPLYIIDGDVDVLNYSYKRMKQLVFEKNDNNYYCDYMITPPNDS